MGRSDEIRNVRASHAPAVSPDSPTTQPNELNPYARPGVARRAAPFLLTIALSYATITLQHVSIDWLWMVGSLGAMLLTLVLAAVAAYKPTPSFALRLAVPLSYLIAIAFLSEATGGATSGYAALMFLAPFWVALHGTRMMLLWVTIALFAGRFALFIGDYSSDEAIRRALIGTIVITVISAATQGRVSTLRMTTQTAEAANAALARSNRELEQFAFISFRMTSRSRFA